MHILIVDDEPHIGENVAEVLGFEGHTVDVARTVAEGLRFAAARIPDVALCDWKLPDGTGADVIDHLYGVPIILMTGMDKRVVSEQHMGQIAGYIIKPFVMGDLMTLINAVMTTQQ